MKKKILAIMALLSIGISAKEVEASSLSFSIKPIKSEFQNPVQKDVGYFDLILEKGREETVSVEVTNGVDHPIKVNINVDSAKTNSNGLVEYSSSVNKADKSLKFNIEDYVKAPKTLELKAGEKKTVDIKVTSPKADAPGIIAGGLTFKEEKTDTKEKESSKEEQGMSITNEFSFVLGFLLRQSEAKVSPDAKLLDVRADHENGRNAIISDVQNFMPAYINHAKINSTVTKKGRDKVLFSKTKEDMQIAPNSLMKYPLELEGQKFTPGKYTMNMVMFGNEDPDGKFKADNNKTYKYKWEMTKDFTITSGDANKLNKSDVEMKQTPLWMYGLIILGLLLLFLLFFLWRKKKKADENESDMTEISEKK